MRKLIVAFGVVALIAGTSSCAKDYTCECTVLGATSTTTAKFKKKADAVAWCEGGTAGICSLK